MDTMNMSTRGLKFGTIQAGREISAITVTDDYLCYKEQKVLTTFFLF